MTDKEIKDALVIKVGDEIEIDPTWNVYKQKVYTVLDVLDTRLTCQVDAKNFFGHRTCIYFKDELSRTTVEKYLHRNHK